MHFNGSNSLIFELINLIEWHKKIPAYLRRDPIHNTNN